MRNKRAGLILLAMFVSLVIGFSVHSIFLSVILFAVSAFLIIKKYNAKSEAIPATAKTREVKETKCTCQACGNVWFYGSKEAFDAKMASVDKFNKTMLKVGTGGIAWLFPDNNNPDKINKCPKCNSSAIKKESVTHII